jgi:hypothetical protein
MAKIVKGKSVRKSRADDVFPLERENFMIIGVGLLFIVAGYIALAGNSVDGFRQVTLSPILLVIGYCVVVPFGLIYRKKQKSEPPAQPGA